MKTVQKIKEYAKEEEVKRIEERERYLRKNFMAAKLRLKKEDGVIGSSTKGHVSHVLAARMSSRPLGWCKTGADRMGKLRAYYWNKGNMLELVRYQKEERERAKGERRILPGDILRSCEKQHVPNGKYYDKIQGSIPASVRKILAIQERMIIS